MVVNFMTSLPQSHNSYNLFNQIHKKMVHLVGYIRLFDKITIGETKIHPVCSLLGLNLKLLSLDTTQNLSYSVRHKTEICHLIKLKRQTLLNKF